VLAARQDAAGRLGPVVDEAAEQVAHDRTLDADVAVAPVFGVLAVAGPLLGDADPAGEADAAVDHQDLAVGAVVQLVQAVPLGRPEPGDRGAGLVELVDEAVVHLGGADRVQQDVDLDTGTRPLGERLGELRRDRAVQ
jgi:hypothetical protein